MGIDFTTLILELINFLILVWLLKHFLYQPILNVVSRRQASINEQLQAAQSASDQAVHIQAEYQQRLTAVEKDRQQAMHLLEEELDTKRTNALKEIREAAAREEEKALRARENQGRQWRREVEQQALLMAARFAAAIFRRAAVPELHHRLVQLALEELKALPMERRQQLQRQLLTEQNTVINSALPLDDNEKQQLQNCLQTQFDVQGAIQFNDNKDLIAGIRLAVGSWTLGLNLADELKGFTNCVHEPIAEE